MTFPTLSRTRRAGLLLLAVAGGCLAGMATYQGPATVEEQRSGVRVICRTEPEMFPQTWLAAPISSAASPLPTPEYRRSERVILDAMSVYPASILKRYLDRVYVVGSLSFYGIHAGGTNSTKRIYVADGGMAKGYSDRAIAE